MPRPVIQIKTKAEGKVLLELEVKGLVEAWWDAWEELDDHSPKDCDILVIERT